MKHACKLTLWNFHISQKPSECFRRRVGLNHGKCPRPLNKTMTSQYFFSNRSYFGNFRQLSETLTKFGGETPETNPNMSWSFRRFPYQCNETKRKPQSTSTQRNCFGQRRPFRITLITEGLFSREFERYRNLENNFAWNWECRTCGHWVWTSSNQMCAIALSKKSHDAMSDFICPGNLSESEFRTERTVLWRNAWVNLLRCFEVWWFSHPNLGTFVNGRQNWEEEVNRKHGRVLGSCGWMWYFTLGAKLQRAAETSFWKDYGNFTGKFNVLVPTAWMMTSLA
jgi:hypothetical protein